MSVTRRDEPEPQAPAHDPLAPSRSRAFRALTLLTLATAISIAIAGDAWSAVADQPVEALLWIAFVSAGGLLTVRVLPRHGLDVSLSAPVALASALVLGPPLALVVNLVALASSRELKRGLSTWARLFNHAQHGLSTWAGAVVAALILDLPYGWILVAAALAAALADRFVNNVFIGLALISLGRLGPSEALRQSAHPVPRFASDFGVVTLLGLLVAIAYQAAAWVAPLLLALPMYLGYRLLRQMRETADRAEALAERVRHLEILEDLNQELHSARYVEHACRITADVLTQALGVAVECDPQGAVSDGLTAVAVGDSEVQLGVPPSLAQTCTSVVHLAAETLGTVLARLAAEHEMERLLLRQQGLADQILVENIGRETSIADQLEDDVLQHVAAGLMQLSNARACLRLGHHKRADQLAEISEDLIDAAISRGRAAVAALRDTTYLEDGDRFDDPDIGQLLARVVEDLSITTPLRCTLSLPDPPPRLPPLLTIAAVQIASSCLRAAAQTEANQAHLQLGVNGHLILEVRSDAGGFQQPPRNVINRVQLAGGTVTVHLDADSGDLLRALIPLVGIPRQALA